MERYLDAARKISRLAVGDPAMPVMVNIHRLDPEHPQDERVDELPFGTRGGLAVRSEFPVDGTYPSEWSWAPRRATTSRSRSTVNASHCDRSAAADAGLRCDARLVSPIGRSRCTPPSVAGGEPAEAQGRWTRRVQWAQQVQQARAADVPGRGRGAAVGPLEFPLTLKAGPRLIGVSFVQRNEARDEATLRPRMRSRGTQPAIDSVTISGPYDVTGPGDSPSRRRIFVCRPASAKGSGEAARQRPKRPRARGRFSRRWRAARTGGRSPTSDLRDLMPFYDARARGRRLRPRHPEGARAAPGQPAVPVPHRARAGERRARHGVSHQRPRARLAPVVLPLEQHSRRRTARRGRGGRAAADPAVLEQQVRADAGRSAVGVAGRPTSPRSGCTCATSRRSVPDEILFPDFDETLRERVPARDGAVPRQHPPREPQRARTADGELHLPERAAGEALRHSERHGELLPARDASRGQPARRAARSGQHPDDDLVLDAHVAGAARQVGAREPARRAAAAAAAGRSGAEDGGQSAGQDADDARGDDAAPRRLRPARAATRAWIRSASRWRTSTRSGGGATRDGEQPIDASGVLPDGTKFDGIAGLKKALARASPSSSSAPWPRSC